MHYAVTTSLNYCSCGVKKEEEEINTFIQQAYIKLIKRYIKKYMFQNSFYFK